MKKILYVASVLIILSMFIGLTGASATWNSYVMSAGVKYRPWDTVPTNTSLVINAARGQWASFQIACKVSNEDVSGADVSVTTPTNGSFLLNAPIMYKEGTYDVIIKSRDDGGVGEWPDPLIPKVDQYYSEKRNAFPFKVNRVSPVYNMFDFSIGSANPVTRNNGAKIKPSISGTYSGSSPLNYHVKIDTGGSLGVATFKWSSNGGVSWNQSGIKTALNISLNNGLSITFPSQTYVLNDEWEFFANPSRTEMVWVECYIPAEAPIGNYTAAVTVSASGKSNQVLNVTIQVYNVTISKTSSIPTYFTGAGRMFLPYGHWGTYDYQHPTETDDLTKRYVESGLYHRINIVDMQRYLTWNPTTKAIGNWTNAQGTGWKDQIAPYANGTWRWGAKLTAIKIPTAGLGFNFAPIVFTSVVKEGDLTQSEKDFLTALTPLFNTEGWLQRSYIVLAEEPNPITTAMTSGVKAASSTIHKISPSYKLIATKKYVADWVGSIDVWASPDYNFAAYPRSAYNGEIAAGRQLWAYLGCMSHGCNATGGASLNKWPSHMIDASLPGLRGYYWLMFDNDVRGDLYYDVFLSYRYYFTGYGYPSPHDTWDSVLDFGADGDGTLFYPGRPDKIGGTTHIPVESIRLKALRMGLEDYEIFKYASDRGYSSYVKTQIENAVGTGKYYYTSPQPSNTAMETARNNILNLFGGSSQPRSGTSTSGSTGALSTTTSTPTSPAGTTAAPQPSLASPQATSTGLSTGKVSSTSVSTAGGPAAEIQAKAGKALLARSAPRDIFTFLGDLNLMAESNAFETSNAKITPGLLGLTAGDRTGREKLIQYVLGYDSSGKKRNRIPGPIVNSQPLVIPYGNSGSVIFVGANDGMLHAFDKATGEELWGFIPYELLSRLKELSQSSALKYFVDGSPKAYVTQSQKIVVFGLRKGGSYYYALDVTDPGDPKFLWKIGSGTPWYSEMGQSWSAPQIGKIKYGAGEKWVCFIGGGYDENQDKKPVTNDDKKGRAVYAIDLLTGVQVWKWDYKKDTNMRSSIPSDVSLVDVNADGYVDRLYVGDMGGKLWRFDLVGSNPNAWSGRIAFDSNVGVLSRGRKIFYPPGISFEKGYEMVFFGTGDPEHLLGGTNLANQIYAFRDKDFKSIFSERDLANVTDGTSSPKSIEDKEGWFINLDQNKGEIVSAPPVVKSGVAYFTTFNPAPGGSGGVTRRYMMDCHSGSYQVGE
jgi:hypothetical protein